MDTQKRISLLVVLIFFFMVPSVAFGQQKVDLKMMTGPTGGSWIPLGGAIADAILHRSSLLLPGGQISDKLWKDSEFIVDRVLEKVYKKC
jgi:hypothetical protein